MPVLQLTTTKKQTTRKKFRRQVVELTGRSACASLRRTSSWSYQSPLLPLPPKSCRLGVWDRRITGLPTSGDRHNVRPTARSPDQRWRSLLLSVIVVGDPHKPTMLRSLAGLRWQCLCRGWPYHHWPFPRHPVLGGRSRAALFFLTADVLRTPSSIALRRVHPCGILHTRCQ